MACRYLVQSVIMIILLIKLLIFTGVVRMSSVDKSAEASSGKKAKFEESSSSQSSSNPSSTSRPSTNPSSSTAKRDGPSSTRPSSKPSSDVPKWLKLSKK